MVRSVFLALGIFLLILGAQTLIVDKWIMSRESHFGPGQTGAQAQAGRAYNNNSNPYRSASYPYRSASYRTGSNRFGNRNYYNQVDQNQNSNTFKRVYQTRDWMPWSLLAAGTIIVLYTFSTGRHHSD